MMFACAWTSEESRIIRGRRYLSRPGQTFLSRSNLPGMNFCLRSTDEGETWTGPIDIDGPPYDDRFWQIPRRASEISAAQTREGKVIALVRPYESPVMWESWSEDGGQSWTSVRYDPNLPEPSCQGSLMRLTDEARFQRNRVLLATPANPAARTHLTIYLSYDECRTWAVSNVLHSGSSAYSDLAIAGDYDVLCLYEADGYSKIVLARFDVQWLTDGKDALRGKER